MKKFEHLAHKIHKNELDDTLRSFGDFISELNIFCAPIGSSANHSKEWLGDIDVAVDPNTIDRATLYLWFKENLKYVSNKGVLSILYPIVNSNGKQTKKKVQIDFMFGDPSVLYLMYYSPVYGVDCPEDSPLKAKHKRILISTYFYTYPISSMTRVNNEETIKDVYRWKWSMSRGVEECHEQLIKDGDSWKKGEPDYVIRTLDNDFETIAKETLCDTANVNAYKSAENLIESIALCGGVTSARSVLDNLKYSPDAKEWTSDEIDYIYSYFHSLWPR